MSDLSARGLALIIEVRRWGKSTSVTWWPNYKTYSETDKKFALITQLFHAKINLGSQKYLENCFAPPFHMAYIGST